MRVTKHMLGVRLARINTKLNTAYELNNAPHYDGWQLTSNQGSYIVQHRLSPREMLTYLEGILFGIDSQKWG